MRCETIIRSRLQDGKGGREKQIRRSMPTRIIEKTAKEKIKKTTVVVVVVDIITVLGWVGHGTGSAGKRNSITSRMRLRNETMTKWGDSMAWAQRSTRPEKKKKKKRASLIKDNLDWNA